MLLKFQKNTLQEREWVSYPLRSRRSCARDLALSPRSVRMGGRGFQISHCRFDQSGGEVGYLYRACSRCNMIRQPLSPRPTGRSVKTGLHLGSGLSYSLHSPAPSRDQCDVEVRKRSRLLWRSSHPKPRSSESGGPRPTPRSSGPDWLHQDEQHGIQPENLGS